LSGIDILKHPVYGVLYVGIASSQLSILVASHAVHLPLAVHEDYVLLAGTEARDIFVYYPVFNRPYCREFELF
jgi:hypothetical protein